MPPPAVRTRSLGSAYHCDAALEQRCGAPSQRPGASDTLAVVLRRPRLGGELVMRVRRPTAADRSALIEHLGGARDVDQASHRIHVAADGAGQGVALWVEPGPGGEPLLGTVKAAPQDRTLFYQLIEACARDALDRGYERASFVVRDARLLSRIRRDFDVAPQAIGWHPDSGEPVEWEVLVELEDALAQLRRVIDG